MKAFDYIAVETIAEACGVLAGHGIPAISPKLKQYDLAFATLGQAVIGTILQRLGTVAQLGMAPDDGSRPSALATSPTHKTADSLGTAFQAPSTAENTVRYEARVLQGIWATAPYLHNGSVANLRELLLPPAKRMKAFYVGTREFDPLNVGFQTDASAPGNTFRFRTQDATGVAIDGNANIGHDYNNAGLKEGDIQALIEYMKTL